MHTKPKIASKCTKHCRDVLYMKDQTKYYTKINRKCKGMNFTTKKKGKYCVCVCVYLYTHAWANKHTCIWIYNRFRGLTFGPDSYITVISSLFDSWISPSIQAKSGSSIQTWDPTTKLS